MSDKIKSKFGFSSATKVYDDLEKKYVVKKKGYTILGPPCSGKSYFVKNQSKKIWVDSDYLFSKLGVKWHLNETNPTEKRLNYLRADYMLEQTKALGFCVIGCLFWEHIPDAIIIPPIDLHKKYMCMRKDMKSLGKRSQVMAIRNLLKKKAKTHKIPVFKSCEEAAEFLQLN